MRGFLQVQAAMGMPGTRISVKPIDLLAAMRFLRVMPRPRSRRARMRYEFEPGQDARLVLEPWEHAVALEGAEHNYTEPKTTRVWGRRRLKLIEGLLPFAEGVDIYLKGRALPSFYAVKLPGMTFLLGLTGWSGSGFTGTGGFDLLAEAAAGQRRRMLEPALALLRERSARLDRRGGGALGDRPAAAVARAGAAVPAGPHACSTSRRAATATASCSRRRPTRQTYFPPDRRRELAAALIAAEQGARRAAAKAEETKKVRIVQGSQYRRGQSEDRPRDHLSRLAHHRCGRRARIRSRSSSTTPGRIIFGRCTCPHFAEHLMNQGPCEHMLALFKASEEQRTDRALERARRRRHATSAPRKQPSRWEVDGPQEGASQ